MQDQLCKKNLEVQLMNDNEIRELLPDYVCDLLNKEESAKIDKLIQNSDSLRKECEELRSYFNSIKTLKPVKAPNNFLNNVQNRIVVTSPLTKVVHKLFHPLQIKIPIELAGLAATVVVVALIFNPFDQKNIPPVEFEDKSEIKSKKLDTQPSSAVEESYQPQKDNLAENEAIEKIVKKEKKTVTRQAKKPVVKTKTANAKEIASSLSSTAKHSKKVDKDNKPAPPPSSRAKKRVGKSIGLFKSEGLAGAGAKAEPESEETLSDDELFAKAIIDRSDSIVQRKTYPKPQAVDVGLLALSIQMKGGAPAEQTINKLSAPDMEYSADNKADELKSSKNTRRTSLRRKKDKQSSVETAPSTKISSQSESPNDLIFAQIESKIKAKKGKLTLPKDKPQTTNKKHYIVEIIPNLFPALRQELESEGILIDKNFYFDSLQVDLIQFNLIVDIK